MNKKVSNSRERILELMEHYGINQTELCKRTGLQKSALSNYLNGDREPRQNQISLIADPFNVNPAWLMGYDVPMENFLQIDVEKNSKEIESAMRLYAYYEMASPEIRTAIDVLLKSAQSLPEVPHPQKDNKE